MTDKDRTSQTRPWYRRPSPLTKGCHIALIGGGIAGLCTALALQKAGYRVTVFDREPHPMAQASGNPVGILDPYLVLGQGADGAFYHQALIHALAFYAALDPDIMVTQGLTKFPVSPPDKQKFQKIIAQETWPQDFMRAAPEGRLDFPICGALSPPKIRDILSDRLSIRCGITISQLDHDRHWTLTDSDQTQYEADAIIICGGPASRHFVQTQHLPLEPVRGQITYLDPEKMADVPSQVLCGRGYLIPPVEVEDRMIMITGASFDRKEISLDIRDSDHQENMANAASLWPLVEGQTIIGGRCALRAYSPDHLPLCGPLPDAGQYQTAYNQLKHGPRHQEFDPAPYQPGLYMVSGLGARGFMSAPLLGDMMSSLISGAPLPLSTPLYESLHPARFLIRNLIRGL
ncbi:MAG: hypothetical protein COB54_04295 [Alphaproteobacteria bacterium]|nr:MAG: hypothetical protein COB54_04295 [Alphaproteobacteria bacterium]